MIARRTVIALLCMTILASATGCGTIINLAKGPVRINGGARLDVHLIGEPEIHGQFVWPFLLFGIFDLPLSAVLDTVLLPLTIPLDLSRDPDRTPP